MMCYGKKINFLKFNNMSKLALYFSQLSYSLYQYNLDIIF